ncbi:MAG: hypothetical protein JST86_00140 [Bacteroidetes bacterium]|nr:hypothetical protein [Bacteroidota bacterium]
MKKAAYNYGCSLMVAGLLFCMSGCKELTEPILSDKQIYIIAPKDSLVTTTAVNTFAWEGLDGATAYQLQIVSPKFDSVARFVTDSVFSRNQISFTLTPGKYQWRVRALNNSSQTSYLTRTLTVQ